MKLIASLTSPYARKVRAVLIEKKIECQLEVGNPWDADTQVPHFNPLGKIPVLVLDDGTPLYDSRVIVEYLDNISPVSRLLPQDNRSLALVKRVEALADGICDAAIAVFLERKRAENEQSAGWMARQLQKVELGLAALSAELGEKPWMRGESYTLADVAVGCCLNYLAFRFAELTWPQDHPNLLNLVEKINQRQSFAETVPPQA